VSAPVRPKKKLQPSPENKVERLPPFLVILHNDDDHSFGYVVDMMQAIFNMKQEDGFRIATEVHEQGKAVVFRGHKERAELKLEQIHSYGPDKRIERCQGSMSASIEPEA